MPSTVDAVAKLMAVLESDSAALDERIAAGRELAKLGDPRATRMDCVLIAAGAFPFRAGADAGSGDAPGCGRGSSDGGGSRAVFVSAFRIDRYPVTVAAYQEFISARGYSLRRFWSDRGWQWRMRESISCPRFWGEQDWSTYLVPNHPVVGVSVYEAEAYASFRGARLPTEAEWEKACRGQDGRCYPWGHAWMDGAAAMRGVGPRCTVPIGCFPRGTSPYGVRDMVGCVWQWCADVADETARVSDTDPFNDPAGYDDDAQRVTRGGAWNTLMWSVSCTSRNGYPPDARFSNLGFRCVVDAE